MGGRTRGREWEVRRGVAGVGAGERDSGGWRRGISVPPTKRYKCARVAGIRGMSHPHLTRTAHPATPTRLVPPLPSLALLVTPRVACPPRITVQTPSASLPPLPPSHSSLLVMVRFGAIAAALALTAAVATTAAAAAGSAATAATSTAALDASAKTSYVVGGGVIVVVTTAKPTPKPTPCVVAAKCVTTKKQKVACPVKTTVSVACPGVYANTKCVKEVVVSGTCVKDVKVTVDCKVPCTKPKPTPTPCVIPVTVVTQVDCSTPGTKVTCPAGVPAGSTCFTVGVKKTCPKTVTVNKKCCKKSVDCSTTTKKAFRCDVKKLVVVPCPASVGVYSNTICKAEKVVSKTCFKNVVTKKTCVKVVAC